MENFNELKAVIAGMEKDVTKYFENGNKAARVRLRKDCQTIKALAQALRIEESTAA